LRTVFVRQQAPVRCFFEASGLQEVRLANTIAQAPFVSIVSTPSGSRREV
jgi:hypothetical protein